MNRLFLASAVALSIGVSGCAGTPPGDLLRAATRQIANPVTPTNIQQVKIAFAAGQDLVQRYQQDCFGSDLPPYPVNLAVIKADPILAVQCKHRVSRWNAMRDAEDKAYNAIVVADQFIARNPSGNAATYISAAWKAVTDYRARTGI